MSEIRETPLTDRHRAAGAKMVPFAGFTMPVQYSSVMEEHRAVRNAAGLFDVSHMGELSIRGPDAESVVQSLTPNDVSRLPPGRAHYSGLLNEDGGYVDDLLVYRFAESEITLVVNAANREKDLAWIESRAEGDVEVEDRSDEWALLALQGPRAQEILAPLTDAALDELRYYRFVRGAVVGRSAVVSRTGYTGEDGFELYLSPDDAGAVWDALLEAGAGRGLVPAGLGARDTLRLEGGMALYGHELDETTTPWEAGLGWVVKLDSGDFVGRKALVDQKERGVERRLVGLEIVGRGIARDGYPVTLGGERVGVVTSGTFSPTFEKAIAMAYVPVESAEEGTEVAVEVRGREVAARVEKLPFYRRSQE